MFINKILGIFGELPYFFPKIQSIVQSYNISKSLRFRGSSSYLNRTPSVEGNRRVWTWSSWIKRGSLGTTQYVYSAFSAGTNECAIKFNTDNTLEICQQVSSSYSIRLITTQVFRDTGAWFHLVVFADTTQLLESSRLRVFINGLEVKDFSSSLYPARNIDTYFNVTTRTHQIGAWNTSNFFNGYMADIYFIDGDNLLPSSFGEINFLTGIWIPKQYSGSYGTNGFNLKFEDNSAATPTTIGKDSSVNGNNWTPNNIDMIVGKTYDSILDTPLENYCILNPLKSNANLTESNLLVSNAAMAGYYTAFATKAMESGKYYWEITVDDDGINARYSGFGIADPTVSIPSIGTGLVNTIGNNAKGWLQTIKSSISLYSTSFSNNGVNINTIGRSTTSGTRIFMVAYDADTGKCWMGYEGSWWTGDPNTGTTPYFTATAPMMPVFHPYNDGSNGSFALRINFGQRPFSYNPPTGFVKLNTNNLPIPSIINPANYMSTSLYTGFSASQSFYNNINGASFQPDLVWTKSRSNTAFHYLIDSSRGSTKSLHSNSPNPESTITTTSVNFDLNGMTYNGPESGLNAIGQKYVAWQWKAGGSSTVDNNGSIQSLVNANPTAGFSIVTYTGTGVQGTVGHGLSSTPSMVIVKNRTGTTSANWRVWHKNLDGISYFLGLNQPTKQSFASTVFNGFNSTTFTVGTDPATNESTRPIIAYCFSEISGYSKFGSYTGNGSDNGPFVYCGFRPRFVLIKRTDVDANWGIIDTSRSYINSGDQWIFSNLTDTEYSGTLGAFIDILSNGFKLRIAGGTGFNTTGGTYIFAAFAETPNKYALAEKSVNNSLISPKFIINSLRFRSGASAYLSRTPSVAGNRNKWTWSGWVKRGSLGVNQSIFAGYSSSTVYSYLQFNSSDQLRYSSTNSGANLITTAVYRDPSAWYHIVVSYDDAQGTTSYRLKLYVNGQQITSFFTASYPNISFGDYINSANVHNIARFPDGTLYFDGYMTEVNFIDGQALSPIAFGEIDTVTGVWTPKEYTGTYGNNGFYLKFGNTASLGFDSSGRSNDWTATNFSVISGANYDVMNDVPVNYDDGGNGRGNYCTLNPLARLSTSSSFTNGNLNASGTDATAIGNIAVKSGKWYAECIYSSAKAGDNIVGVQSLHIFESNNAPAPIRTTGSVGYDSIGGTTSKVVDNVFSSYGASWTSNDVIGVALDLDNNQITFYKNGVSQGVINYTFSSYGPWTFANGIGSTPASIAFSWNFGQRPFAYTPPTGFKAINTNNLQTPTIINPANYMAVTTYTGTGSAQSIRNTVNNISFQPDLVWIKARNVNSNHSIFDSVRGVQQKLCSNLTNQQSASPLSLTSFNSNGFSSLSDYDTNFNGSTYVAWQWKANNNVVTNTQGTITSQVNANPTAGFSIVRYTGTSVQSDTVGHGLGTIPDFIICKNISVDLYSWVTFNKNLSANYNINLNTISSQSLASSYSGGGLSTSPSNTTFGFIQGTASLRNVNYLNNNYIAYCFSEVEGFSKFGQYTGIGSTTGSIDGPFVYTGFKPAYIIIKSFNNGNWNVWDNTRSSYNVMNETLYPNNVNLESGSGGIIDFLSNGFKLRYCAADYCFSNQKYMYFAFAESPFKYSLAR